MLEDHDSPYTRDSIEAHTHGDWNGTGTMRGLAYAFLIVMLVISAIVWMYNGIVALGAQQ